MRLVIASDTHTHHNKLEVPYGDVFIHCGDSTFRGSHDNLRRFGSWVRSLPHRHKIVVPGNHEPTLDPSHPEYDPTCLFEFLSFFTDDDMYYLDEDSVVIEGVKFYGLPWTPYFHGWGFNAQRGEDIASHWAKIPEGTDVLITHGPPYGVLDQTDHGPAGCVDLLLKVKEIRPKIHSFGHIHAGSGIEYHEGTTFVNAAICDEAYKPTNPCRVIDL